MRDVIYFYFVPRHLTSSGRDIDSLYCTWALYLCAVYMHMHIYQFQQFQQQLLQ
jgi:hypothetical protein